MTKFINFRKLLIVLPFLLGVYAEYSISESLPQYHPLREDRVAIERPNSARQMTNNVNKKFEGIADRFGDNDFEGAMENLQKMLNWNLTKYEEAVVYQFMGFIYVNQNKIDDAIEVFSKCVEYNVLGNTQHQGTLFNIASLYGSKEQWDLAIASLMEFFKYEKDPAAESYIMTGIAYFQQGKPLEALPYITMANLKSLEPKQSWLELELAILFLNKRYDDAINIVKQLATYWPEKEKYWETMAGAYMEMQKDADALAALNLGYKNNSIEKKETLESLARLSLYLEIPYQAAVIMQENMDAGLIEKNEDNLRLLLGAWTSAREFKEAIEVIDVLAPMIEDGSLFIQKAMLLNEMSDWDGIKEATEMALLDPNLENPGDVFILRGMAHTELEEYDQAIKSFTEAIEVGTESNKRNAESWIEYVSDRRG